MKKKILILSALITMLVICFSITALAEGGSTVVVTVNSTEGYSETGGNFVESNLTGFDGGKSKYAGAASAAAYFRPDVTEAGSYRVLIYNISNSSAATQAEVTVKHNSGEYKIQYNQVSAPTGWMEIGVFDFDKGTDGYVSIGNSKSETLRLYGIKLEKVETEDNEIFSDISELTHKSEIELLAKLGITADVSGKDFRPYDNITRGEWAIWTAKAAGLDDKAGKREIFYDVPSTHPACGAVAALYDAGVINGIGNDAFRPDRPITELEGITMLLRVMGYNAKADLEPYPAGYIKCASQLRLGNCGQVPVSRDNAADIFYKALDCRVYEMLPNSSYIEYRQSDETLIEKVFKLEPLEGMVTDNGISSLYGRSEIGVRQIAIDNSVYGCDGEISYDYLGVSVRAYVSTDDDTVVKYIFPDRKASTLSISVEDLYKINGNSIEYYNTANSRKTIKFSDNVVIIYNGMAAESFDLDSLLEDEADNGTVTAIDNDNNGVYEVLNITLYKTYTVHRINKNSEQIFVKDKNNNGTFINTDPNKLLYIAVKEEGVKLDSIENLKEWDVISVAQSLDSDGVTVIYRSTKNITGSITRMDDDYIYIDGDETKKCFNLYDNTGGFSAGNEYSFGLDKDGRIAWVRDSQNVSDGFGYLINYCVDENDGTSIFKILEQSGEINTYEGAEKWVLNGVGVESGSEAYALMDGSAAKQQIIRYSLNGEGKVNKAETAQDNLSGNVSGSFTLDFRNVKGDEGYVRAGNYKTIASRYVIPSGMLLFVVPQRGMTTKDMNRYYVADDKSLIANTDYDFDGYNINENEEITIGVMYAAENVGLWARSPIMVIDKVGTSYDENTGETVYEISGYVNSEYMSIRTESTETVGRYRTASGEIVASGSLKNGDIIQYSLGKKGVLCNNSFKLLFSPGKSGSDENMVSSKDTVRARSIYGDMYYAYGWVVKTQANGFVFNTDAGNERLITLMPDIPVLLVDSGSINTHVELSSVSEISVDDSVFVTAVNTNTQMIVIYR